VYYRYGALDSETKEIIIQEGQILNAENTIVEIVGVFAMKAVISPSYLISVVFID